MTVVSHPWGDEPTGYAYADITPLPIPSSLPLLGRSGYLLRGQSHLIAAKEKVGKTTLLLRAVQEWWQSLGDACPDVLWISEESMVVWGTRRQIVTDPLPIRLFPARACNDWFSYVLSHPYEVVILDTASSVLRVADSNSNDEVHRVMTMWTDMMALQERTLIVVHHQKKGSETHGDGVQGARAWLRAVDIFLEIQIQDDVRELSGMGRFGDIPTIKYDSDFKITQKESVRRKRCRVCKELFDPPWSTATLCYDCFDERL